MDCVCDSSTSLSSVSDCQIHCTNSETPQHNHLHCDFLIFLSPICRSLLTYRAQQPPGHRIMGLCGSKPEGCVRGRLVPSGKRNRRRRRRSIKRRTSSLKLDSTSAPNRPHSTPTCAGFYLHFPFSLAFFVFFFTFTFLIVESFHGWRSDLVHVLQ